MRQRFSVSRWYLWMPLLLCGYERCLERWLPSVFLFSFIAVRDQPLRFLGTALLTSFRVLATYGVVTAGWELIAAAAGLPVLRRLASFLVFYGLMLVWQSLEHPALGSFFWGSPALLPWIFAAVLWKSPQEMPPSSKARLPLERYVLVILALLLGLRLTRSGAWQPSELAHSKELSDKKSFLLVSFDGVPAEFFFEHAEDKFVTPSVAKRWAKEATVFDNAYSVINSTYASWYSILSGRYPAHTGIQSLFPSRRFTEPRRDLLPEVLRREGYRTVFMTDCGSTSFMTEDLGFEERYQAGRGFLECGQGLFTSGHPFTAFLNTLSQGTLFPELASFCSAVYEPRRFFQNVASTLETLSQSSQPYLLAVHSCVTHHSLFHQLPRRGSALYDQLPSRELNWSKEKMEFMLPLRVADSLLDELLVSASKLKSPPRQFVFADHGIKIAEDAKGQFKQFSHGFGEPLSRYQYHVPFLVIPSLDKAARHESRLVTLMDLYPTILKAAGLTPPPHDGRSLYEPSENRGLILTSALPPAASETDRKNVSSLIRLARMNSKGELAFSAEDEAKIFQSASVAYLRLPYRLVQRKNLAPRFFNEISDPHNLTDISQTFPGLLAQWQSEAAQAALP